MNYRFIVHHSFPDSPVIGYEEEVHDTFELGCKIQEMDELSNIICSKKYEDSDLENIKKANEGNARRKVLDDEIRAAYDKLKV